MASYSGSYLDFEKFIGPRLRNIVQTKISRSYKREKGGCEECEVTNNLEAAHIHGRGRKELIREACKGHLNGDMLENIDLQLFEDLFIRLHEPKEGVFKILCKDCHRKYDRVIVVSDYEEVSDEENETNDVLPIEFYPSDKDEFKELLLQHRSANIVTHYDGNVPSITEEWNAQRFSVSSDVLRNLRSRPQFRQGNWQNLGIRNVEVSINYRNI